jgi:hypothetical protein
MMSRVSRLLVLAALATASLAGGCSTLRLYEGPELPSERAAFVLLGEKWRMSHLTGSQQLWVDGRGVESPVYRAAVAPGCHSIDYRLCPRCYVIGGQRQRRYALAPGRSYEMSCNLLTTCAKPTAPNTLAFDVNYDPSSRYCCSFVDADSGAAPPVCGQVMRHQ